LVIQPAVLNTGNITEIQAVNDRAWMEQGLEMAGEAALNIFEGMGNNPW
jgi:hypothetical protein